MTFRWTLLTLALMLNTCLLFGQAKDPVTIANTYLQENLKELQLTQSDITEAVVSDLVVSRHNKITHLYFQQYHQGIPVHNAINNFNILEDGKVLSMGNRFISQLDRRINTTTPGLSMSEALLSFMQQFNIASDASIRILEQESAQVATFDPSGLALEPIRIKLVYQAMEDRSVHLAWNIEFYELDAQHWWSARIDAIDGKVLDYFDQVVHCEFGESHAHDGCDAHAHPAEAKHFAPTPSTTHNTSTSSSMLVDGSKYNVYPMPVESPSHGDRAIVEAPADPEASPYGWHDTNGEVGPEFTITRGNNVHAYHDIFANNQSFGDEPDGGDTLCFDYDLDLSNAFPYTQIDPLVTNLFYWNNLMHDVWYHYGFDEAAGNFQFTNYTGDGIGSDEVNAEALDGSGTNNANFATPPDGQNSRMQMFLWGGQLPDLSGATLTVTAPEDYIGDYGYAQAAFGGNLPGENDEPLAGLVVLADDGFGIGSDACEDLINGEEIAGNIAMIDRGTCEFGFKCLAAEEAGAIAVVICNNVSGGTISMAPGAVGDQVTIPAVMMSLADCNTLKMGLPDLRIEFTGGGLQVPQPGPSGLSSDLDNGVIVHEYTHGISIRLTGGPSQSGCLTNQEQAGEGWSDWFALVMTATPEMTADQARGIGTYVLGEPTTGVGIRTHPYSRSMTTNPHTYVNINNESVPHGVGSVFCVTIWDLYWNLVDEYGFDEDIYFGTGGNNMAMQLVLDGLKLQPCNPNFIEARDAILEADMVNYDGANQCLIWETFARRGIGASATVGGNEAFDLPLSCSFVYNVEKTAVEEAEAGSVITYTLEILNSRMEGISNASITDQLPEGTAFIPGSSNCDITEEDGVLTFNLGDLASGDVVTCTYQVEISNTPFSYINFEDGVENGLGNWEFENPVGAASWGGTFTNTNSGNFAFYAENIDSESDQLLILEEPVILDGENPALTFWHYYDTEASWDGGVVEISTDGTNWEDLGDAMIVNGYTGPLQDNPASPISGRLAFHGKSNDWIRTVVDLSDYTNTPIQIRWRLGCDGLVGGDGWYIDDIRFYGNFRQITNIACTDDEEPLCSEVSTVIFGDPTSSTTELGKAEELSLFPNPTKGSFTIQLVNALPKTAELRVLAMDGRLLTRFEDDNFQSREIDLSAYGAGVYLVQLLTENGSTIRRVVVE
jgi:extracellular elastinolytic metalloproteinase